MSEPVQKMTADHAQGILAGGSAQQSTIVKPVNNPVRPHEISLGVPMPPIWLWVASFVSAIAWVVIIAMALGGHLQP